MHAHAEGRADAAELQGGTQEGAAQAGSVEVVVGAALAVRAEPDGVVGLVAVDEFQRLHAPGARIAAFVGADLVHHAELVALAQVAQEVDLGAEDVGHLHGDRVGDARRVGGTEQRGADGADRDAGLLFGALGDFLGLVAVGAVGRHVQQPRDHLPAGFVAGGVDVAQPDQVAVLVGGGLYRATRVQLVDAARAGVVGQEVLQPRAVDVQALQHGGQGVAGADAGFADIGGVAGVADLHLARLERQDAVDQAQGEVRSGRAVEPCPARRRRRTGRARRLSGCGGAGRRHAR